MCALAGLALALGCRRAPASGSAVEIRPLVEVGGAEQLPPLPRFPDPPVIEGGCERFDPPAPDDLRLLEVEVLHTLPRGRRPVIISGSPLTPALDCRSDIDTHIPVEFCLQRPDGTVLRREAGYRNADVSCYGCDPYPGAPADVCDNACQSERHVPEFEAFEGGATSAEGAYLLSVEFPSQACTPASVIVDVVGPELAG